MHSSLPRLGIAAAFALATLGTIGDAAADPYGRDANTPPYGGAYGAYGIRPMGGGPISAPVPGVGGYGPGLGGTWGFYQGPGMGGSWQLYQGPGMGGSWGAYQGPGMGGSWGAYQGPGMGGSWSGFR